MLGIHIEKVACSANEGGEGRSGEGLSIGADEKRQRYVAPRLHV